MPDDNYYNSASGPGAFVPTTNIWDVQELYEVDIKSDEFKELLVRLYQNINNIALSLNIKDSAYYSQSEFVNGQLFFPNPTQLQDPLDNPDYRQVFRMTINFGPLPNAGTISIPHNINVIPGFTFTRIYGAASNSGSTSFIPLPYSSPTLNKNIEVNLDTVNVNITTAIDYSAYITSYIIVEYLKN
jgi:hypothetical protein